MTALDASSPGAAAPALHKRLSPLAILLLTLSCISPVFSVYGVGSDVLAQAGTGAAGLFLLAIGAAVIWAVVYAELGSAYPYAGGDYVGIGSILGSSAGVATLAIWAATSGPNVAFEAQIIGAYTHDWAPWLSPGAATFMALAVSITVALLAVRVGALVTGVFLAVEMIAVIILILVGFAHPAPGAIGLLTHPVAPIRGGGLAPTAFAALALAGVSAVFATVGGNQAIYFGEELHNPRRYLGRVILASGLVGAFATALPVIAVVVGSRNLGAVLHSPAPFATFMAEAAGAPAGHALSAVVALAILNAMIAQIMSNARLFFSLGRDQLFTAWVNRQLAGVHRKSGAPRAATLTVGVFAALCCVLSVHTLLVFITGLLVYGWGLVCLAVLIGRRRGLTGGVGFWRSPLYPAAPVLGLVMAAGFAIADLADPEAGRPSVILMGVLIVVVVAWNRLVLQRRPGGWTPARPEADL